VSICNEDNSNGETNTYCTHMHNTANNHEADQSTMHTIIHNTLTCRYYAHMQILRLIRTTNTQTQTQTQTITPTTATTISTRTTRTTTITTKIIITTTTTMPARTLCLVWLVYFDVNSGVNRRFQTLILMQHTLIAHLL
jgi:hypothetical protein